MTTPPFAPPAAVSHFDKDNENSAVAEIDPFAPTEEADPFAPPEETAPLADPFMIIEEADLFVPDEESLSFAPPEEVDPFISREEASLFEMPVPEAETLKEERKNNSPPDSFFEEPNFEDSSISKKTTKMGDFFSELTNLSENFENQEAELIVLPEIEEKLLMKKKESNLPPLVFSQNEKAVNSQNENFVCPPDGLITALLHDSQQELPPAEVPLQRVFFEGFQQEPITVQTTLIEARSVSSLGTPLIHEWAYDNARGPVFSPVIEKEPEQTNERGIIESLPALLLRLGFLRFQYHVFSLQAYQSGHLGVGQVLEQFNSMLETAMKKFAAFSAVSTYGLQFLHMETTGPGVFMSEETFENIHWLLCEEERFHLVLLPELSAKMAAAGQSLVYEALLQFSSSTALRFAWLTMTYNKLFTEMIYKNKDKTGWVCLSCGHILFEKEPFDCPFCAALPCSFVLLKQFGYFIEDAKLIEM